MRKTHLTFALVLLIAGVVTFTGVQLQAGAQDANAALCGSTGLPCDNSYDCTNIGNPTCYCSWISGADHGVCREDAPLDIPLDEIIDIESN